MRAISDQSPPRRDGSSRRPQYASSTSSGGAAAARRMRARGQTVMTASSSSSSSRRRNMAFMKYGEEDRRSETSLHACREHARQLVMRMSSEDADSPRKNHQGFADFANFNNLTSSQSTRHTDNNNNLSLFEEDPFGSGAAAQMPPPPSQQRKDDSFVADWPTDFDSPLKAAQQTMETMPRNSSMQSAYAGRHPSTDHATPTKPRTRHIGSPDIRPSASNVSTTSGAAARRRMRKQMRAGELTPPQSPYSTTGSQHYASGNHSVGSASSASRSRLGDHVQHYSSNHSRTGSYSNRSLSGRSTETSTEGSDIFDHRSNVGTGFTFDAFGLDASQINAQVNEAMQDLAGSHPDWSFFQQDNDDFANGRWNQQASPAPSRASTPPISEEDRDEFVDGFRVTKKQLPVNNIRPYPSSPSERSSLTSESNHLEDARMHLFKEKVGRTVVRPSVETEQRRGPRLPDLAHRQIEFVGEDSDASYPNRASRQLSYSDAGAPSMHSGADSDEPFDQEVRRPRRSGDLDEMSNKKSSTDTATTAETSGTYQMTYEEKKEEERKPQHQGRSVRTQWYRDETNPVSTASSSKRYSPKTPASVSPSLTRQSLENHQARLESPQNSHDSRYQGRDLPQTAPPKGSSPYQSPSPRSYHSQSPRSEGGAMLRSSHVSSVLDRIKAQEARASDAKSDTGSTPSPYQVKLRRTGLLTRPSEDAAESPVKRMAQSYEQSQVQENLPVNVANPSPRATSTTPSPKKMTYRERRELELQKEKEEQEQLEEANMSPPEKDVASLIRKRIAANKKAISPQSVDSAEAGDRVGSLKPTTAPYTRSSSTNSSTESHRETPAKIEASSAIQPKIQKQTSNATDTSNDLSIESGDLSDTSNVKPSAAVSHMLMLQQIQKKKDPSFDDDDLSPEKRHQMLISVGSGDADEHRKSQTPKATKMMLNAFLAGRSSIDERAEVSGGDPSGNGSGLPALKDDPKYQKYFKMLKLGMPKEQVQHAMLRDGEDPSVLDQDPNKPVGVPLKDDPTYQKYFKMLRVGMPMEAVKHAMIRDGLDCSVMDQDHNLPVNKMAKKDDEEEPKERDSHRRARLHWKTLRKVTSNSLWARLDQEVDMSGIEIDEEEFQELFQAEHDEVKPTKSTTTAQAKGVTVRVIDSKRANNGGIILARLKMSHDDMADAVDRINEHALTAEQIEHIIEYLPTKEERKALEAYMLEGGQDAAEKFEGLCECEKFMVSMMTVKHAKRKVRALLFKLQFEKCLDDILKDTLAIENACDNLFHSVRLRQLLGIILNFGNRLNTAGNKKRKAGAFTLDSLLKLNQAKAFDRKTTFLNYIVLIVQRNNEILLNFKDDLPAVFKADKVFWDQCLSDLEEVENQLENVRKIALYQARQAHYRFRRRRKQDDDGDESLGEDDIDMSLEEEVEALRSTPVGLFTLSAIKYVSSLRDKVEETKRKFAQLLEYFGEEDKNRQPHELFSTMVSFCRDFDKAKEEVFALEKKKQREERKRQAGRPPTHSPAPPNEKKRQPMLKASSHQPNFSDAMRTSERQPSNGHHVPTQHQSPRHANRPAYERSHSSPQESHQSPRHASRHAYERSHSSPQETQNASRSYSRSSFMPEAHPSYQHTPYTDSQYASTSSQGGAQSAAARLKAKARMHHRSSPPSSQERPTPEEYYESQARGSPQAAHQDYSTHQQSYSPSPRSTGSGRSDSRSSFRDRRRMEARERIRQSSSRD